MGFNTETHVLTAERKECINRIIASYEGSASKLLEILLEIQDSADEKYISESTAYYVSEQMNLKITQIYDVISFFSALSEKPRAKYPIQVCSSIVCKVCGGDSTMQNLKELLYKEINEPTYDGRFIIEEVPCFGACDVAPAIRINGVVYGNIHTKEQLVDILKNLP